MEDAFEWYQIQMSGLGFAFLDEVDEGVHRIVSWPQAHSAIGWDQRRCLIRRFPYGLIYRIDGDTIIVLAVAHLHRKPRYWMVRK
jgi:hypothetical protein